MTDREKLIELLRVEVRCPDEVNSCRDCPYHVMAMPGHCDEAAATADMLIANGVVISNLETATDKDTNVLTNGDRIRAMTDEELAKFLFDIAWDGEYTHWVNALEWLKQPAEVKEDG